MRNQKEFFACSNKSARTIRELLLFLIANIGISISGAGKPARATLQRYANAPPEPLVS